MTTVSLVATICAGLVLCTWGVADFEDHFGGYTIIFHSSYDLLIAIHGNKCYFVHTPDNQQSHLNGGTFVVTPLQHTEKSLINHINRNSSGEVKLSSLAAVRDKFKDLLADFHCLDKHIYEVNFFGDFDANAGNLTSGNHHLCHDLSKGSHPYPGDCHKFIVCTNGLTFVESCAPGTAFLASNQDCVFSHEVPGCKDNV